MQFKRLFCDTKNDKSYFILGPRGTGKSFWIKNYLKPDVYINLLDDEIYQRLQANPSRLIQYITVENPKVIVIDEIQKIPALTNLVHKLIEEKKWKFVLTGSSARKLKRENANLLAGRALTTYFFPLVAQELKEQFKLEESLRYGHLPTIFAEGDSIEDKERYLQSYLMTYLKEEVVQEGLIRNISVFSHFLEVASFSQASVLNVSSVARDVGRDPKVINEYFQILEDLLIAVRLPIFHRKAKRELITRPKFYYFDVGVYRSIRPTGPLDDQNAINGHALETFVFQELRALNEYLHWGFSISYWHTKENVEVDFILYGKKGLVAIEVKLSDRFSESDLKGLKLFAKEFPVARAIFLYGGKQELRHEKIRIIPVKLFLTNPANYILA